MTLLSRLFATFALGLIATGLVIGFLPGGECEKAFFPGKNQFIDKPGCAEDRAHRRELPVALLGLGLTTGVAALVVASATPVARRPVATAGTGEGE